MSKIVIRIVVKIFGSLVANTPYKIDEQRRFSILQHLKEEV